MAKVQEYVCIVDSTGTPIGLGTSAGMFVQGPVADGGASTARPVIVGGVDGSGNAKTVVIDSAGHLYTTAEMAGANNSDAQAFNLGLLGRSTDAGGYSFHSTNMISNGTTWDRLKTAGAAANTTGAGLLGTGPLFFDGTNYQLARQASSADGGIVGVGATALCVRVNSANYSAIASAGDADGTSGSRIALVEGRLYNESSFDHPRANTDQTILASAARTSTQTVTFTNYNSQYLRVVLDVTNAGTGNITLTIDAQDAVSGKWVTLLTGAAVSTNSTNVYRVGPGLTAAANATVNDFLSRNMRVVVTHNNGNSITYSVGRQLTGW